MAADIEKQARLIESLSATMTNNMWSDEVLTRCRQIRQAVDEIEKSARKSEFGER